MLLLTSYGSIGQDLDQIDTIGFEQTKSNSIQFAGVYKGQSLFVHNPYDRSNKCFCIDYVEINEQEYVLNLQLTALEIPFSGFEKYVPVNIVIHHKEGCTPQILNKNAVIIHSSFKFQNVSLNDSSLVWSTMGDRSDAVFVVSYLKYGIWREDTVIQAKGVFEGANYGYDVLLKTGSNKYRIKYVLPNGRYLYSNEVENVFYPEPIDIYPIEVVDKLNLSRAVNWEIVNEEGRVLLQGKLKEIPLRRLKPGQYFIRMDEQTEGFVKK